MHNPTFAPRSTRANFTIEDVQHSRDRQQVPLPTKSYGTVQHCQSLAAKAIEFKGYELHRFHPLQAGREWHL